MRGGHRSERVNLEFREEDGDPGTERRLMELSSFKKKETRQTEAVAQGHRALGGAAGLEGCTGDQLSWQLALTGQHGAGRVGLEGRGRVWRCRRPAQGVFPALERPVGILFTVKGDRLGWRGKRPHPGPREGVLGQSPSCGEVHAHRSTRAAGRSAGPGPSPEPRLGPRGQPAWSALLGPRL